MELKIPEEIKRQPQDILEFAYIAQQKLQELHNSQGAKFTSKVITKNEWKDWCMNYFLPRSISISAEIMRSKTLLKESVKYQPDLDKDFLE